MPKPLSLAVAVMLGIVPLHAQDSDRPKDGGLDWATLMQRTGTKPIVVPKGSQSGDEVGKSYDHWRKTHIVDPELARLKGAPDEKETSEFFLRAIGYWSNRNHDKYTEAFVKTAMAIIDGNTRRPVIDFFAAYVCKKSNHGNHMLKGYGFVADAPADAPIHRLLPVLAQAEVLDYMDTHNQGEVKAAQKRYLELLAAHLGTEADAEDGHWIQFYHLNSAITEVRDRKREHQHIDLYQTSKLPEWARLTLEGDAERALSWRYAGKGWGNPEKPESVEKHWEAASKALTRAWELNPAQPEAAQIMIIVTEVGKSNPETLRLWFDRAMAAQYDFDPAFRCYLNAMRPYWGGSYDQMLAFGRACAETKRFDSDLPIRFNQAVHGVAYSTKDWRALYRHPELSKLLFETRENRLKTIPDGNFNKIYQSCQLCAEAWAAGDLDRAARALDGIRMADGSYHYYADVAKIPWDLNVDWKLMFSEIWLHKGDAREDYAKGVEALGARRFDEAGKFFQDAIPKAHRDAIPLLSANIALADFQQRYNKGGWVAIPAHQRLCWNQSDGENIWDPEAKRLKLTGDWVFGKSLFRGKLGQNFEVRGHFKTTGAGPRSAGFGIYCGQSPMFTGRGRSSWWSVRVDCNNPKENAVCFSFKYSAEKKRINIPWEEDNEFLYRRENGRVSFSVGGRELITGREIGNDAPSGECAWGIGVLGQGNGASSEVWDLEARRLDREL